MTTAIMSSTQYQVNLSITVNIHADKTLLFIAGLIALAIYMVAGAKRELAYLASDFVEAARFTNTVFAIGFKSLAFGMGVNL